MSVKKSGGEKKKRRRAVIQEPGPEQQQLEVKAPAAKVHTKSKSTKVDGKSPTAEVTTKSKGGRKTAENERKLLSPDAQRNKAAALRLYKDLRVGRSSDTDEGSFGTDRFILGGLDEFSRARRGQRITGELK